MKWPLYPLIIHISLPFHWWTSSILIWAWTEWWELRRKNRKRNKGLCLSKIICWLKVALTSLYLYVGGKGLEPWAQTTANNMTCILSCVMHMTHLSQWVHCIEKIVMSFSYWLLKSKTLNMFGPKFYHILATIVVLATIYLCVCSLGRRFELLL